MLFIFISSISNSLTVYLLVAYPIIKIIYSFNSIIPELNNDNKEIFLAIDPSLRFSDTIINITNPIEHAMIQIIPTSSLHN